MLQMGAKLFITGMWLLLVKLYKIKDLTLLWNMEWGNAMKKQVFVCFHYYWLLRHQHDGLVVRLSTSQSGKVMGSNLWSYQSLLPPCQMLWME